MTQNVPLREWIRSESVNSLRVVGEGATAAQRELESNRRRRQSWLRKATVAYGVATLIRDVRFRSRGENDRAVAEFGIDDFIVQIIAPSSPGASDGAPWNNVVGVSVKLPSNGCPLLKAQISKPFFLSDLEADGSDGCDNLGMYLEVDIVPPLQGRENTDFEGSNIASIDVDGEDDGIGRDVQRGYCYQFGIFLYELYAGISPVAYSPSSHECNASAEPQCKKRSIASEQTSTNFFVPLRELGFPSSLCCLVQNLIGGHESYACIDDASSDIHSMLNDPDCFLFGLDDAAAAADAGRLCLKEGKLYGREDEASRITDAFCRVSDGQNESFFIGGYSGSGKTMLVRSIRARVDVSGGYVLTQKVDQMSMENHPFLDILSAFNELCLLIATKSSPEKLAEISGRLAVEFYSDYSVLTRLLLGSALFFPQNTLARDWNETNVEQVLSFHNVCFTLQRFVRIVSSKSNPVVLFLDDIQWASKHTLDLIRNLLADDMMGPSCFFFIGSYRDNEVRPEHPIFDMMAGIESRGVTVTRLHLEGLNRDNLGEMISETLCTSPHVCKPLIDIVHDKTKGNPFYAVELLQSLVDQGMLEYSLRERRWIWNIDKIRGMGITDNVLHLLTTKMKTSLAENVRLVLKVVSCFGIKVEGSIVGYLNQTAKYSGFVGSLNQAIREGCIQQVGQDYKFSHDKVREAAYSLIPDNEKNQFHHELGLAIYSVIQNHEELGSAIFSIAGQLNNDASLIPCDKRDDIAQLNFKAGLIAMESSDYQTAYSYFHHASSLLPGDHWAINYKFSLRLTFSRGKAAYSSGYTTEAQGLFAEIIEKGQCIEDKLDAYYYRATILFGCDERSRAMEICRDVLAALNESIPTSIDASEVPAIIKRTGEMLGRLDLSEMTEIDRPLRYTLKFYSILTSIIFWEQPSLLPFLLSNMIRLTSNHGLCNESILAIIHFGGLLCIVGKKKEEIENGVRFAALALSMVKKWDFLEMKSHMYHSYYGFVAVNTQPLHSCCLGLLTGIQVGLSSGETAHAFHNVMNFIIFSFFCGENLGKLLKKADYYLELMDKFDSKLHKSFLFTYRSTISALKDNSTPAESSDDEIGSGSVRGAKMNKMLRSFWQGHVQRCAYYGEMVLKTPSLGRQPRLQATFYHTLNCCRGVQCKNGRYQVATKKLKQAIATLTPAVSLCPANWQNKQYLLEAELCSFKKNRSGAERGYAHAIAAAASSGFIHEKGLSCELAGLHYKKIGDLPKALDFFCQAKECYAEWGSQMKVDSISQQIQTIALPS